MRRRDMSANDYPIAEADRRYRSPAVLFASLTRPELGIPPAAADVHFTPA